MLLLLLALATNPAAAGSDSAGCLLRAISDEMPNMWAVFFAVDACQYLSFARRRLPSASTGASVAEAPPLATPGIPGRQLGDSSDSWGLLVASSAVACSCWAVAG